MHDIEMHQVSEEFARCWQAAGRHLQSKVQGPLHSWLKADLNPPFLEHLSFRLGNQLFFIRIEDVDGRLKIPGSHAGLLSVADGCKGYACLMPMRRRESGWTSDEPGWGLIDARTGKSVDPANEITDERIEMTDWELQDFAVQIVRQHLEKHGRKLMSWQGNPAVNPSIWFVGENGPEWFVVRAVRYPKSEAEPSADWEQIASSYAAMSKTGHFASVSIASADDPFDPNSSMPPEPLWRGYGMLVRLRSSSPGRRHRPGRLGLVNALSLTALSSGSLIRFRALSARQAAE